MAIAGPALAQIARGLHTTGFALVPTALPSGLIDALYREQTRLFAAGHAHPAAVGRGVARELRPATRGDDIL